MDENIITSSAKWVDGKRIMCLSGSTLTFHRQIQKRIVLRRKTPLAAVDFNSSDPRNYFKSIWNRQVDIRNLLESGVFKKDTYQKYLNGEIDRFQIEKELKPNLIGTRSSISGLYLTKLDRYLTAEEAFDEGFITKNLFLELIQRAVSSGIYITRSEDDPSELKIHQFDKIEDYLINKYSDSTKHNEEFIEDLKKRLKTSINSVIGFGKKQRTIHDYLTIGKLPFEDAIIPLEAQHQTGGLVDPKHNVKYPLSECPKRNLVSNALKEDLEDAEKTSEDTEDSCLDDEDILVKIKHYQSTLTALFDDVKKIQNHSLQFKLSCDDFHELDVVFIKSDMVQPLGTRDNIVFDTAWNKSAKLGDLENDNLVVPDVADGLCSGILDKDQIEKSLKPWLHGNPMPIAGVVIAATGERLSIKDAVEKDLIKDGLGVALLEAQAANGFIIDAVSQNGDTMSVEDAIKAGLIPQRREEIIKRAEKALSGFDYKNIDGDTEHTKSLFEAINMNLIPKEHALRLLEAQRVTGGIIDPYKNYRIDTLKKAVFAGLISQKIADELEKDSPTFKGFLDINTGENLTYRELLKRTIPDEIHGLPMIIHRDMSVSNEAPLGISQGNESIISKISAELGKEVTIDEIREAQIFKPDILSSIENGKLEDDEIDILLPSLESRISGKNPIAGVLNWETNEKLSFIRAMKLDFMRETLAKDLIEAQAACGKITNPETGSLVDSAERALELDLITDSMAKSVDRALKFAKFNSPEDISVVDALSNKKILERTGLKYLDSQLSTGGLIFPTKPFRLTLKQAHQMQLISAKIASKCKGNYFQDVNNDQKRVNYRQLLIQSYEDKQTGLRYVICNKKRKASSIEPLSLSLNDSGEMTRSQLGDSGTSSRVRFDSMNSGLDSSVQGGFAASSDSFRESQGAFVPKAGASNTTSLSHSAEGRGVDRGGKRTRKQNKATKEAEMVDSISSNKSSTTRRILAINSGFRHGRRVIRRSHRTGSPARSSRLVRFAIPRPYGSVRNSPRRYASPGRFSLRFQSHMRRLTSSERRRKQGKLMVEIHEGYKMELRTAVSRGLIDSDSARQLVDSISKK